MKCAQTLADRTIKLSDARRAQMNSIRQVVKKYVVVRNETPLILAAKVAKKLIGNANSLIQLGKFGLNDRRAKDGFPWKEGGNGLRGIGARNAKRDAEIFATPGNIIDTRVKKKGIKIGDRQTTEAFLQDRAQRTARNANNFDATRGGPGRVRQRLQHGISNHQHLEKTGRGRDSNRELGRELAEVGRQREIKRQTIRNKATSGWEEKDVSLSRTGQN